MNDNMLNCSDGIITSDTAQEEAATYPYWKYPQYGNEHMIIKDIDYNEGAYRIYDGILERKFVQYKYSNK